MLVELCLWEAQVSLKTHRVSALSRLEIRWEYWRFPRNVLKYDVRIPRGILCNFTNFEFE